MMKPDAKLHNQDKELADKLVEAGIAFKNIYGYSHTRLPVGSDFVDAPDLLRDWRVAGAVMEQNEWGISYTRRRSDGLWAAWTDSKTVKAGARNESLPRAIIEAGVIALQENSDE